MSGRYKQIEARGTRNAQTLFLHHQARMIARNYFSQFLSAAQGWSEITVATENVCFGVVKVVLSYIDPSRFDVPDSHEWLHIEVFFIDTWMFTRESQEYTWHLLQVKGPKDRNVIDSQGLNALRADHSLPLVDKTSLSGALRFVRDWDGSAIYVMVEDTNAFRRCLAQHQADRQASTEVWPERIVFNGPDQLILAQCLAQGWIAQKDVQARAQEATTSYNALFARAQAGSVTISLTSDTGSSG